MGKVHLSWATNESVRALLTRPFLLLLLRLW